MPFFARQAGRLLVLAAAGLLGGCATTSDGPNDPLEGFNRAMFSLNEGIDKAVLRPVAVGYSKVTPQPVQTGVTNFFSNIEDVFIGFNNLIQGKPAAALSDGMRFLFNSTLGLLGVMDVASGFGFEKHDEDFGQSFGRWGVGEGPYLVLPFFGPRTTRDAGGLVLDVHVDPVGNVDHVATRNTLLVTRVVSDRAELLPADRIIEEAALDKYSYIRDAYLQRRRNLVHDGTPPSRTEDPEEQPRQGPSRN